MCVCCAGVQLSFAEVQEAVRLTKQTAIGYIRGQGSGYSSSSQGSSVLKLTQGSRQHERQRKAVLGCSASHRVTFREADRIVVIAQVRCSHIYSMAPGCFVGCTHCTGIIQSQTKRQVVYDPPPRSVLRPANSASASTYADMLPSCAVVFCAQDYNM